MEHKAFESKYLDDFEIGDRWKTHTKTITECDIITFNNLVGLAAPAFIDEEYIKTKTLFKRRFASGVMTIPVAAALFTQLHIIDDCILAMVGMEAKMLKPLFAGDTIYVAIEVLEKKQVTNPDRGIVSFLYLPINQQGDTLAEIKEMILLRKRPK